MSEDLSVMDEFLPNRRQHMRFERIPGFEGKIYVPKAQPGSIKKHDCPDCYACQMCGDDRCELCCQGKDGAAIKNPAGISDPDKPVGA